METYTKTQNGPGWNHYRHRLVATNPKETNSECITDHIHMVSEYEVSKLMIINDVKPILAMRPTLRSADGQAVGNINIEDADVATELAQTAGKTEGMFTAFQLG